LFRGGERNPEEDAYEKEKEEEKKKAFQSFLPKKDR